MPQRDTGKKLRVNEQIRISPIRLIDENEEQVGVIELDDARSRARDADLDLVEVAPQARPPVCRIMDYGKWKYQQKKKESKAKSHAKQSELKEVRLRPNIDDHDLSIKMAKAREFLEEGDKVQFTMLFRGRQMVHRDLALQLMQDLAADLGTLGKIEAAPRLMGRRMTMMLAPDKKPGVKKQSKPKADKPKKEKQEKPAEAASEAPAEPAAAEAEQPQAEQPQDSTTAS